MGGWNNQCGWKTSLIIIATDQFHNSFQLKTNCKAQFLKLLGTFLSYRHENNKWGSEIRISGVEFSTHY